MSHPPVSITGTSDHPAKPAEGADGSDDTGWKSVFGQAPKGSVDEVRALLHDEFDRIWQYLTDTPDELGRDVA